MSIPKTIKIGETEISTDSPEMKSLISSVSENVAKAEKDKLYSKIQALETTIASMKLAPPSVSVQSVAGNKPAHLLEQERQINEYHTQLDALRRRFDETFGDGKSLRAVVEEAVISVASETLKAQHEAMLSAIKPILANLEAQHRATVEAHRAKVIEENKGTIIASLIKGDTIEAINASLEVSKTAFKEIAEVHGLNPVQTPSVTQQAPVQQAPAQPTIQAPQVVEQVAPQAPVFNGNPSSEQPKTLLDRIKDMSPAEYAKHREALAMQAGIPIG
jgi:hypothetical protein